MIGFLQNSYFKPGTLQRHIDMYKTDALFRKRVLAMTKTGKILIKALGQPLYDHIYWDNASTQHGFLRDFAAVPNVTHVTQVIEEQCPHVVLCFGKSAQRAVEQASANFGDTFVVLNFPHPQARGITRLEWIKYGTLVKRAALIG